VSTRYKSLRQMDDKEALTRVEDDYAKYKSNKESEDIPRAERYMAIYQALDSPETRIDEGTGKIEDDTSRFSNTYMPIGAAVVDAWASMAFNTIFASDDYFEMAADNWEDALFAPKITAHMKKRHREMRFRQKVYEALIDMAVFPYAITGTKWLLRPGNVPKREKIITHKKLGRLSLPYQEVKVNYRWVPDAIDRPDMFRIDYFRFYHDPESPGGFEFSEQAFDDYDEPLENLVMMAEAHPNVYKNIDHVLKTVIAQKNTTPTEVSDVDATKKFIGSRRVTVKRCWSADHIIEFCYGKIIRRMNCAGWPLQRWGIYPIPGKFNMMSILQRMERNQMDINASLNSRRDFQNLVDDPIKVIDQSLIDAGGTAADKTFYSKGGDPSKKIFIANPGVNYADRTMEDVALQKSMIEEITISKNDMGAYNPGRRSATESYQVKAGSSNKTIRIIQTIEDGPLIDIYSNQFMLEQMFLTDEKRFMHFGKYGDELMTVGPEAYAWRSFPEFIPKGSYEMLDEPVRMQQFMNGMDRAMMFPQGHNLEAIFAHFWSKIEPRNYQAFVKDPRDKKYNIPAKLENVMIVYGKRPEVSSANDHKEHKAVHNSLKRAPDYPMWPETKKMMLEDHIAEHDQMELGNKTTEMRAPGDTLMASNANQMRGVRPMTMPNMGGMPQ
jgi:hypothetical protein